MAVIAPRQVAALGVRPALAGFLEFRERVGFPLEKCAVRRDRERKLEHVAVERLDQRMAAVIARASRCGVRIDKSSESDQIDGATATAARGAARGRTSRSITSWAAADSGSVMMENCVTLCRGCHRCSTMSTNGAGRGAVARR